MTRDGRLLRLSFSESVCRAICDKTPGAVVERVTLRVGREVPAGRASGNGLYAICKTTGWPLRVTLFKELADHWRHETRIVRECRVEFDRLNE